MTIETWLAFVGLWVLLGLPIGPNAIATLSASAHAGVRAGLAVAAGITAAGLVHAVLATVGFGAVLAASPDAFTVLRLLGAGYLAWLGIRLIRRAGRPVAETDAPARSAWGAARYGAMVSLSNPKAILTYMAAFPATIDPARPLGLQMAILLPTALTIVFAIYGTHAVIGAGAGRVLGSPTCKRWFDRLSGGMFIACAGSIAASALRR